MSKSSGVFWVNPSETYIDIHHKAKDEAKDIETHWMSESGILEFFLYQGTSQLDVIAKYSDTTGHGFLPAISTLGYHQCRWNYHSVSDVLEVNKSFDDHDIPYDFIWLDIEHLDNRKYFTWHPESFKDSERMINELDSVKRNLVTIVDPHIKRDPNYHVHDQALDGGHYVQDCYGAPYTGDCWPGSSSWPDFFRSSVRNWWEDLFKYENYTPTKNNVMIWNDMSEPSVFSGPEVTMEKANRHVFDDGIIHEHRNVHNLYGLYYHKSTYQGLLNRNPGANQRAFILTRAFFSGSQK
mmetsp:Transcript_3080/g.3312  ORF Transcript_3080/g.3312 Transcript_3080/m.3312 type:complete len:295 (+) Transcript_3080:291-1175(+)